MDMDRSRVQWHTGQAGCQQVTNQGERAAWRQSGGVRSHMVYINEIRLRAIHSVNSSHALALHSGDTNKRCHGLAVHWTIQPGWHFTEGNRQPSSQLHTSNTVYIRNTHTTFTSHYSNIWAYSSVPMFTRNHRQCLLWGTAILARPSTHYHKRTHFPTYTVHAVQKIIIIHMQKIGKCGLKFRTLWWRLAEQRKIWTWVLVYQATGSQPVRLAMIQALLTWAHPATEMELGHGSLGQQLWPGWVVSRVKV